MKQRRPLLISALGLIAGLALGAVLFSGVLPRLFAGSAPAQGKPAPDFSLSTPAGESYRLSEQRGKVVIVNFWATWCKPCKAEMPLLQETAARHPELMILAVNYDESPFTVNEYIHAAGIRFPVLMDPGGEINTRYQVQGYPTTFFIDQTGVLRFQHIGQLLSNSLSDYLEALGVTS